jgi:hypothetical protein
MATYVVRAILNLIVSDKPNYSELEGKMFRLELNVRNLGIF